VGEALARTLNPIPRPTTSRARPRFLPAQEARMPAPTDGLSEERRKEVFAALVAAQDRGVPVAPSRWEIAVRYGLTAADVARIEQEGMDNDWPPL